jgi:DNA-binding NtrC family response regulator
VDRTLIVAHGDPASGRQLEQLLAPQGFRLAGARDADELLARLEGQGADLVLLDMHLPGPGGLETFLALQERFPDLPVVTLFREEAPEEAAQSLLLGAADSIRVPAEPNELRARVVRLLNSEAPAGRQEPAWSATDLQVGRRRIVSLSPAMQKAVGVLMRIAPTRSTVLLLGESGVGKELFARAIHYNSPRQRGPWIPLNCSAIPESIIESELFGHERGAFTGAVRQTRGKFEIAQYGTIFLDEIAEMNRGVQTKLLRVLEEKELMRVGGNRAIRIDVRLVAATNRDLEEQMRSGQFREDLYFRLNVVTIRVPSLRDRREDLPLLVDQFVEEAARDNGAPRRRLGPAVMDLFAHYPWPGNVRELKNLLENLVLTTTGPEITVEHLPERLRRPGSAAGEPEPFRPGMSMKEAEKELIRRTLEHVRGNRTHAARLLRIGIRTLQRKIVRYGIG